MDSSTFRSIEEVPEVEEEPSLSAPWGGPQQHSKKRACRGVRRPTARWNDEGDADGGLLVEPEDEPGSGAGSGDGGVASGSFIEQAFPVRRPWAEAEAAQGQQEWDSVRPAVQRSYVGHLPRVVALREERLAMLKALLEERLAAVPACCPTCHGENLQQLEPVLVLYVSTECCFKLAVPRHACLTVGCGGVFAPSPFAAGCFPATPKVSWDVAQASAAQPARWFDLSMLHLLDGLIFQPSRSTAVYGLASVIHRQHVLNGCGNLLGWEHFKRQLGDVLMVGCPPTCI